MTTDSSSGGLAGPVLVIGSGLIGASVGLALARAGVEVILDDVDDDSLAVAVSAGAGRRLREGDEPVVVVVAVPPRHAAQVLADASTRWPGVTVTDVTSVKESVLDQARAAGADPRTLVGGHPMAGREVSGAGGALANLFDDRLWIVTPTSESGIEHVRRVHQLASTVGAVPVEMGAREHDEAVALVSHTPQVLASVLAGQLGPDQIDAVRVAGQGLRDMTRIAASNVGMWTDILTVNAEPVAQVLDRVAEQLARTARALRDVEEGGDEGLTEVSRMLADGVVGQQRIPGKHGAAPSAYREVLVRIADQPGELGRLFAAAAEANVNLEDVRIEHVLGRPSGLVGLAVRPDAGQTLIEELRARGYEVRA